MKEADAPVVREDGEPSDVTLEMLGMTRESWDERQQTHRWADGQWRPRDESQPAYRDPFRPRGPDNEVSDADDIVAAIDTILYEDMQGGTSDPSVTLRRVLEVVVPALARHPDQAVRTASLSLVVALDLEFVEPDWATKPD